jgi:hypothetical protein
MLLRAVRSNTRRFLPLVVVVAAVMPAAVTAGSSRTAGTLTMSVPLALNHGYENPSGDCPPPADECVPRRMFGPFAGLGEVDGRYEVKADFGAPACAEPDARVLGHPLRLVVAGKGELRLLVADAPCVALSEVVNEAQTFSVTGGTGSYAGAYGSGTLTPILGALGVNGRYGRMTVTGTLEVPGLEFDLTKPVLTGATNKTVKARKGAKSARVSFRVTAQDDRDGAVPVSCSPRSGFAFPVGKTRVDCATSDASANIVKASFTVTVKRRR